MKRKRWTSAAASRICAAAGGAKTVEEATRIISERLLQGVPLPPTDLDKVAAKLNVGRFEKEDMPLSGQLRRDGDTFKVVFSSYLSPARKRFTIAHELGHAFFETTGSNCPRVGRELERICDMFAVELLLPRSAFLKTAGTNASIEHLKELSRLFGTSLASTALRYAEFFRATIFEVEGQAIRWATGIVRKGPLQFSPEGLREGIEDAFQGRTIREAFYVGTDLWRLEWCPLGRTARGLFLLVPEQPSQSRLRVHKKLVHPLQEPEP